MLARRVARMGGNSARRLLAITLVLCLFVGCTPAVTVPAVTTIRIGGAEPRSLDPLLNGTIDQNNLLRLMFDPLIASDANGNPMPALAATVPTRANGGISADGRTIVYHLRHDVRWHDGVAFTSRDVAFSTRAMLDPNVPVISRRGYDAIASVSTPDAYTVRVRLKRPFAPFVATYFSESDYPIYPVPEHILGHVADIEHAAFDGQPVGDGPFRFVSWKRGDRVALVANDAYYGGRPQTRALVWQFESNENTIVAGLRSGELDVAPSLTTVAANQLVKDSRVRIVATPVNGYFGLMINTRHVADVRVRRAIALALDTRALRDEIAHGLYHPAVADLPQFLWAFDRYLKPIAYDPMQARALLRAAGYDASRPYPLELAIIAGRRTDEQFAVLVQAELARVNVVVHIRAIDAHVYSETAAAGGTLAAGRYDLTVYTWIAGMDPDDSSQFLCDQRPPNGANRAFYCSAEMDAAQAAALAVDDRPTRKRAYAWIESLLVRDVPLVFIAAITDPTAIRATLTGFRPNPITPCVGAQHWRVSQ
jgi:peptide/nickel transport system substrate-binding protein